MNEFTFQDIIDQTGAQSIGGDPSSTFRGVSTDTRSIRRGDLFLALQGPNFDGNAFATEALAAGAAGVLLAGGGKSSFIDLPDGTPVALHQRPRKALSELAAWHRGRLEIPVIAVTGSCGKTTTKNILLELLSDQCNVTGSPASFNNDIGVPHTLMLANQDADLLVVEMGTNQPGEIAALCRTARPTCGIITNVGASHLAGLGSLEGVADEKGALAASIPSDGFCILNGDCRFTPTLRGMTSSRVITFTVDGSGDFDATNVWFHAAGTTFLLNGRYEVTVPMLGLHSVQNLLAALAACVGLGYDLEAVLPAVSRLRSGRRRMERLELGGLTLFDDSYNANPESARASVRVLTGLHGHARRVLVLGDMLELGEFAAELHHEVGVLAAEGGVDLLLLVGDLSRATAAGALEGGMSPGSVVHFEDIDAGLGIMPGLMRDGDVVLVKASRAAGLDRLVQHIATVKS